MKKHTLLTVAAIAAIMSTSTAGAQVIYNDYFGAVSGDNGYLKGTKPDTKDTQNGVYAVGPYYASDGIYYNSGTAAVTPSALEPNNAYTQAYLPVNTTAAFVNGTSVGPDGSAPALNGTKAFTLSATMTPTANTAVSLYLLNGNPNGGNFGENTASFNTFSSFTLTQYSIYDNAGGVYGNGAGAGYNYTANELYTLFTPDVATTFSLTYNPTALTLTFAATPNGNDPNHGAGHPFSESIGVTQAEIAGLTGVGFGFSSQDNGQTDPTGTASHFELSLGTPNSGGGGESAVPEPSTVWLMSFGFLGLMVHVYRRRNAQV